MAESTKGSSGIWSRLFHRDDKKSEDKRPKSVTDEKVTAVSIRKNKSKSFTKEQRNQRKAISSDDRPLVPNSIGRVGRSSIVLNPSKESEARNSLAQNDLQLAYLPLSPAFEEKKIKKESTKFTVVNVSNISPSPKEFESIFSTRQFFSHAEIFFKFKDPPKEDIKAKEKSSTEEIAEKPKEEIIKEAKSLIPKENPFEWLIDYLQTNLNLDAKFSAKEQIERLKKPLQEEEDLFLQTLITNYQQSWRTLTDAKPFMAKQLIDQQKLESVIEEPFNSLVKEIKNLKNMTFDKAYETFYNDIGFRIIRTFVPIYDYLYFLASIEPILHNGIKNLIAKLGEKAFRVNSVEKQKFIFYINKTDDYFFVVHTRELNILEVVADQEVRETRSYTQLAQLSPEESYNAFEKKYAEKTQPIGTCFATIEQKKDTKVMSITKTITFKPGEYHPDVKNTEKQKQIEKAFQSLDNVSSHPIQRRLTKNKSPQS